MYAEDGGLIEVDGVTVEDNERGNKVEEDGGKVKVFDLEPRSEENAFLASMRILSGEEDHPSLRLDAVVGEVVRVDQAFAVGWIMGSPFATALEVVQSLEKRGFCVVSTSEAGDVAVSLCGPSVDPNISL